MSWGGSRTFVSTVGKGAKRWRRPLGDGRGRAPGWVGAEREGNGGCVPLPCDDQGPGPRVKAPEVDWSLSRARVLEGRRRGGRGGTRKVSTWLNRSYPRNSRALQEKHLHPGDKPRQPWPDLRTWSRQSPSNGAAWVRFGAIAIRQNRLFLALLSRGVKATVEGGLLGRRIFPPPLRMRLLPRHSEPPGVELMGGFEPL